MLTIADKPKNAMGVESLLWDNLIETDYEILMGTQHNSWVCLMEARRYMRDYKLEHFDELHAQVFDRYIEKFVK